MERLAWSGWRKIPSKMLVDHHISFVAGRRERGNPSGAVGLNLRFCTALRSFAVIPKSL